VSRSSLFFHSFHTGCEAFRIRMLGAVPPLFHTLSYHNVSIFVGTTVYRDGRGLYRKIILKFILIEMS
jgi:hypothetical protein